MKRHDLLKIPSEVKFISDWKEFGFHLVSNKCIINKKVPGCGFTEFYLTNNENVILCSPRIMLLENKYEQHINLDGFEKIHFVRNPFDSDKGIDKDMTSSKIPKNITIRTITQEEENQRNKSVYNEIRNKLLYYMNHMNSLNLPHKIIVTYDSYHIVKDILEFEKVFDSFTTMVDEFQVILDDSRFKANTELKFMKVLDSVEKVHFVSATPMLDKYIEMLDEFKDIDYYELDWSSLNPSRVIKPNLEVHAMKSISSVIKPIIQSYLNGEFESNFYIDENGLVHEIESKEAVFYLNSVNHIISIIKSMNLTPDQVNILCANTEDNRNRIKKKLGKNFSIGSVPKKKDLHKMFTFCTRTVYLGADFYSTNARSFVFSDANSDCLSIDISQDLPQILGRQRLKENPWSNSAHFYYRVTADYRKMKKEDFDKIIDGKIDKTNNQLLALDLVENNVKARKEILDAYRLIVEVEKFKNSYISVNGEGDNRYAVLNHYTYVSDLRAFDIQQVDYKDRFSVFREIENNIKLDDNLSDIIKNYDILTRVSDKIRFLCSLKDSDENKLQLLLNQLTEDDYAKQYFLVAGYDKCKSLGFNTTTIRKYISTLTTVSRERVKEEIIKEFQVGDNIPRSEIKSRIAKIYKNSEYDAAPKASDLFNWFDIKGSKVIVDGKKVNGYKIIRLL